MVYFIFCLLLIYYCITFHANKLLLLLLLLPLQCVTFHIFILWEHFVLSYLLTNTLRLKLSLQLPPWNESPCFYQMVVDVHLHINRVNRLAASRICWHHSSPCDPQIIQFDLGSSGKEAERLFGVYLRSVLLLSFSSHSLSFICHASPFRLCSLTQLWGSGERCKLT